MSTTQDKRRADNCATAVFFGVTWREVRNYYWAGLTTLASEQTNSLDGIGVVDGRMVRFAGHEDVIA